MIVTSERTNRTPLIARSLGSLSSAVPLPRMRCYDKDMAIALITEATRFAIDAHGEQRYRRKPYQVHLIDVVNVLRRFIDWDDLPQEFIDAAWLHDVLEDTSTTQQCIE